MDWEIPIGRIVVGQEDASVMGIPVSPWVSTCIRAHPWVGWVGAWCLLGEACVVSAALSHQVDWLAEKAFQGMIWTGSGVALNLLVAGTVQKIGTHLNIPFLQRSQLFSRTLTATFCCITWCQE